MLKNQAKKTPVQYDQIKFIQTTVEKTGKMSQGPIVKTRVVIVRNSMMTKLGATDLVPSSPTRSKRKRNQRGPRWSPALMSHMSTN